MLIGKLLAIGMLVVVCFYGINYLSNSIVIGSATVVDGDSLVVAGKPVTLFGVDALEDGQRCRFNGKWWPCGKFATAAMKRLVGDANVTCRPVESETVKGRVARCFTGGKSDLGEALVRQGWAFPTSDGDQEYHAALTQAQKTLAGVWSSQFDYPWALADATKGAK